MRKKTAKVAAKLSRRQLMGIEALLVCPTVVAAAKQIGATQRTLRRWLRDRDFIQALDRARRELRDDIAERLKKKALDAADVLTEVSQNKKAPANSRVSAARAIIELAVRTGENRMIEHRIEELEETVRRQEEQKR